MHITGTTNVCDEDQVEVGVPIDGESDTSPSPARYPSVSNRHNTSSVLSNVLEDRLREVKVVLRRIAPAPSIVRKGIVWWAEIGGCDHNGTRQTPFGVIYTSNLIARTTAQAIVEQSSAQCCSICPIPLTVEVSIPTSTTHCPRSITASIESGTSVNPSTSTISMRTGDHCKKTHQTKPISKSHFHWDEVE